jgi:LmbE family N-acetylglucosaminyl deacetylase
VLTDGAGSHPNSRTFPPDRLRAERTREVRDAVACLGLPPDRIVLLGEPDTAAPHDGAAFEAVVARLVALIGQEAACTTILAPWRNDPHCDHEAASLAAASVASAVGIRHVAYPVWGWMLPADQPVNAPLTTGWRLDVSEFLPAKRRAIEAHQTQYGRLITDDPTGFQLPAGLLALFDSPFETFLTP